MLRLRATRTRRLGGIARRHSGVRPLDNGFSQAISFESQEGRSEIQINSALADDDRAISHR